MVLGICLVIFEGAGLCLKERGRCFSLSGAKYLPLTFICLILGAVRFVSIYILLRLLPWVLGIWCSKMAFFDTLIINRTIRVEIIIC